MFDKLYLTQERSAGPTHVTIHEHKAPTDASVKLYDELLTKARAEIVSCVAHGLENNVMSHAVLRANYNLQTMDNEYFVVFRLNGQEHKVKFNVQNDPAEIMERAIASELCRALGRELRRTMPLKRG